MTAEADSAAAYLAAVQERYEGAAAHKDLHRWASEFEQRGGGSEYDWMARSLIDVPRLAAAVEAAVTLLADWDRTARYCDTIAERAEQAPRRILLGARAQAHDECAKALREAITTELLRGNSG